MAVLNEVMALGITSLCTLLNADVMDSSTKAADTWAPGCPNRLAHPGAQIMSALL